MTNFFDEIIGGMGLEAAAVKGEFKIAMLGARSAYIEGHKGLNIFSSDEMNFKVKGGSVKVLGERLELKNFSKKSALVVGKIKNIELVENGKI